MKFKAQQEIFYIKLHQISFTGVIFKSKGLTLILFILLDDLYGWLRQLRIFPIKVILKIQSANWAIYRTFQPRFCTISVKYMPTR